MFPAEPPPKVANSTLFFDFFNSSLYLSLVLYVDQSFFLFQKIRRELRAQERQVARSRDQNPAPSPVEERIPVSSSSSQSVVSPTNKNNKNGETFHDNLDLVEEEVDICVVEARQTVPQWEVTGGGNQIQFRFFL